MQLLQKLDYSWIFETNRALKNGMFEKVGLNLECHFADILVYHGVQENKFNHR